MNYRKVFYDKSDEDLIMTLEEHNQMNLDAKYALGEIIKARQINVNAALFNELQEDLNNELKKVVNLDYIKHLGLSMQSDNGSVVIKRSLEFKVANWVGVLIGFLLSFTLIPAFSSWTLVYEEGLSTMGLVNSIILSLIGTFGIILLIRTLSRVLANIGFKIVKQGDFVFIHNLVDANSKVIEASSGALSLEKESGEVYIAVDVGGRMLKLIKSSGGQIHKRTIKELYQILK